jgi:hypothetical protein
MTGTLGIIAVLAQEYLDLHVPIPEVGGSQVITMALAFVKVVAIGIAVLWILSFLNCEVGQLRRWREQLRRRALYKRYNGYKYREKF